jgi:hypothetical protein
MDNLLSDFTLPHDMDDNTAPMATDPTPRDQAIYIPSLPPGFCKDIHAQNWQRPLPQGVEANDLNILDPNGKLLHLAWVMSSAGQALNQNSPCIITQRNRRATRVMVDSGGYQCATKGRMITSDAERQKVLSWQESVGDLGLTLDIPTGPLLNKAKPYVCATQRECLTKTIEHLDYWQRHHTQGKVRWLNILQGNDTRFSDTWYRETMKRAGFCDGIAFAGVLRHNMEHVIRRLLQMAEENHLQRISHIHVLGTNELDVAVLLTAIQRAINKHINKDLRISCDTGAPSKMLTWNKIYTLPRFDSKSMTMQSMDAPDGEKFLGSNRRWPWPSPIGDRMVMSDFVVDRSQPNTRWRDTQSCHLMVHHNIGALCSGVAQANRVFDVQATNHDHQVGRHVGAAIEAIERIFESGGSQAEFQKLKGVFTLLRHGQTPDAGDDLRDHD